MHSYISNRTDNYRRNWSSLEDIHDNISMLNDLLSIAAYRHDHMIISFYNTGKKKPKSSRLLHSRSTR